MNVEEKLKEFFEKKTTIKFKKGEEIIGGDEQPTAVYFIKKGLVKQYYISQKGSEFTLNIFKQNAFFPMAWTIADIKNTNYYEAMTEVELAKVTKEEMKNFLSKNTDVIFDLIKRIYIGLEGIWIRMETLMAQNAPAKVASVLWIFGKRFGEEKGGWAKVGFKLTEHDLASYAGLTRETVSRILQDYKKKQIVKIENGEYNIDLEKTREEMEKV